MASPRKQFTGLDFLGSQTITNLPAPSTPNEPARKIDLDNALAGLAWKQPVRVASLANVTLSSALAAGQVLDGITLVSGDRVLLAGQTTGTENGIYVVTAGVPTRATDADTTAELQSATVYIVSGTANKDKAFTQTADSPVVGTTALTWAQVGGGTAYTAGSGLALSGSQFSAVAKAGGGIIVDGTGISVDSSVVGSVKSYSQDVPTSASAAITHNLGRTDVLVQVFETATGDEVECQKTRTSANVVTLGFGTAPTTGQFRVTIQG